jgi:L-arabinose isomerase
VWFVTGSQHLYGEETLRAVGQHAAEIAASLHDAAAIPVDLVGKGVLTTPEEIRAICIEASSSERCVGLIAWMHTFSPAKMWIGGLTSLQKPLLHLHTQYNEALPWSEIDMDFMNTNQSAHGDREFGHILARLHIDRTVVVGHWKQPAVAERIGAWSRSAAGVAEARRLKVVRFGDNMRQVAVTEGDKVEAEIRFGFSVNTHGINDLTDVVGSVSAKDAEALVATYDDEYDVAEPLRRGGAQRAALVDAARIELGLRSFLEEGGYRAFTDTFEDLGALTQLPGIAVQRLMRDGYGFAAEGDWKTAALVRVMKLMSDGLPGGTSFMEDYTYDFTPGSEAVLGSHMLEVCPSIAGGVPTCEIHPLGIGGRSDPVRLVFTAPAGEAVVAALVDLGDRFRMLVNPVDVVEPREALPRLPVARAVWHPRPDLSTAAAAWILAGGPHHTSLSYALTADHMADFAAMVGVEVVTIDESTSLRAFQRELQWNDAYATLRGRI